MAVTSIWPVKGRVDTVINYARNPEKTTEASYEELASLHAIDNVVEYAANDMKTEHRSYVSCLNCQEDSAAAQFVGTKQLWRKSDGRACYHGYQSFKADEVTAEVAHEIGVKLAKELWGDRFEVVIATHCNTGHYHTHFVINSVSFADGMKFYNSPADYARMREVSDRLCREYSLSVIEHPGNQAKSYAEWQAEKDGRPTNKGMIRQDIDAAILASTTRQGFFKELRDMGYELKFTGKSGAPLKYPGLKPPGAKGFFRFHKLGEGYTLDAIDQRILSKYVKLDPFSKEDRKMVAQYRARDQPPYQKRVTGLRGLYLRYSYELHIIEKYPASVKRVSFFLREDVAKMDQLDQQTRFLAKTGIETIDQLMGRRSEAVSQITQLTEERKTLNNSIQRFTRHGDTAAAQEAKERRNAISAELKKLRKEVSLCDGIALRSAQTREELEKLLDEQELTERRNNPDELLRRRSGTGREDELRGR
jgi:hypothetical protein